MKRYIKASYEDTFWEIHDRDYSTGTKLEAIVDQLGLTDEFFPEEGDPQVTEDAYEKVLDIYRGNQKLNDVVPRSAEDVCHDIVDCLNSTRGVRNAYYEDSIEAIRFTLSDGYEYQLVLQTLDM